MTKVFNSTFETGLRLICLLAQVDSAMDLERIMLLDLIACYGRDFGITDVNLHGDGSMKAAELSARRVRIRKALRQMVLEGNVTMDEENLLCYRISERGRRYVDSLHSEYARSYFATAQKAYGVYGQHSNTALMSLICGKK